MIGDPMTGVPVRKFFSSPAVRASLALMGIIIIGCIFNADGTFFRWGTHRDMLRQASEFGILACGMTLVIITAGIDLAVGSVLGLVAVTFSLCTFHLGWSGYWAIPAGLLVGTVAGIFSGTLIAWFKMQPFIATLAMMTFLRGLAKQICGGQKVTQAVQHSDGSFEFVDLPYVFSLIDQRILSDSISVITILFLVLVLVLGLALRNMKMGRYLYAIGGNETAARLAGVPIALSKIIAYGLCGFTAGLAGICHATQEQQGNPEAGATYELYAIAIVVIGGTNLMGGRGGILLTLIGTLTIGYMDKILSINAIGEPGRLMLTGLIIVGAVLIQKNRS
jgi:ribose transport system permease protein